MTRWFVNYLMEDAALTGKPNMTTDTHWSLRIACLWIFGLLLIASAVAVRLPVMDTHVRVLLLVTLFFGVFTGIVFLLKYIANRPTALYPVVILCVLGIVWSVLANKPFDPVLMRDSYSRRLEEFVGVKYVWGGESSVGIDCSGLARTALWQSMLRQGFKELNPRLLGPALWEFWWRDMSSQDMLRGKYGYTKTIGQANKLAGYNTDKLSVGDLAVAGGGSHVLIYYGQGRWIEANPDDRKVVVNKATAGSKRPYFNMAVTFKRWWMFEKQRE